jgi:hypothetical protein
MRMHSWLCRRPGQACHRCPVRSASTFRSALLLVDEVTGYAIIEAIWPGPPELAASRGTVRADLAESAGWVIRAPEESGLVFNPTRKAWARYLPERGMRSASRRRESEADM